jgi:hypothetical protein
MPTARTLPRSNSKISGGHSWQHARFFAVGSALLTRSPIASSLAFIHGTFGHALPRNRVTVIVETKVELPTESEVRPASGSAA